MTSKSPDAAPNRPPELPPEVIQILWPALKVGGFSGFSGLLFGSFAGIARSNHPALFAMGSSLQWFTLGTTFWATRATLLHTWGEDQITPKDKISASSIAGCIGGGFGGLLRGKGNIIWGAIVFGVLGAGGQKLYNTMDSQRLGEGRAEIQKAKAGWMDSKWNPVKVLTDEEYTKMLEEKLLRVNADIAIIDDDIKALRSQETERKSDKEANNKPSI